VNGVYCSKDAVIASLDVSSMRGTDASTHIPTVEEVSVGDMMSSDRAIPHDSVPHSDLQSLLEFFPWDAASKYNDGSRFDRLG